MVGKGAEHVVKLPIIEEKLQVVSDKLAALSDGVSQSGEENVLMRERVTLTSLVW
jgi:hypothetical protein